MRRRSLLASLALVAPTFLGATRVHATGAATISGTLELVDTARAMLRVRVNGGSRTGRLTPQTLVTIDGMPGDVRDLRPGQRVALHFAVTRGGETRQDLVRVDVRSRAPR